jgi:hypothetical protein
MHHSGEITPRECECVSVVIKVVIARLDRATQYSRDVRD